MTDGFQKWKICWELMTRIKQLTREFVFCGMSVQKVLDKIFINMINYIFKEWILYQIYENG